MIASKPARRAAGRGLAAQPRYPRPAHIAAAEWAARVPGEPGHILLNPFGLHDSEVCASNLVNVDAAGQVADGSSWPINPAGFTFHGAIHATLPEAHCVMDVHTARLRGAGGGRRAGPAAADR